MFYFATCQAGFEKALKSEVMSRYPTLTFAFSRPGFVTFTNKNPNQPLELTLLPLLQFARLFGESIAQQKNIQNQNELLSWLTEQGVSASSTLHVFAREEALSLDPNFETILKYFVDAQSPKSDFIFDLIYIDEGHYFLGRHRARALPFFNTPNNRFEKSVHPDSPSTAYLKIEEAIERFEAQLTPGASVLEIGCSPGGASLALLHRKQNVIGVDPKKMDPRILAHPNFHSIQKPGSALSLDDLKNVSPESIVIDMNLAPLEAIDELTHALKCISNKKKLKYGFFTLKLNHLDFAQHLPLYVKRLEQLGFKVKYQHQLSVNKQETFVFANYSHSMVPGGFEVKS